MKVIIENKKIIQCIENKKHIFSNNIVKKLSIIIAKLEASVDIYDIWNNKSYNFKKMQGYDNRYSIRINDYYRLEMTIKWLNNEQTVGNIYLEEISNHYN